MKHNKIRKKLLITLLLLSFVIIYSSCAIYKIYKYANYCSQTGENLPDTFRIELPLLIDSIGYFCIQGQINQQIPLMFIIDTQAVGLIKKEDVEKYKMKYWGVLPLSTKNAYGQKYKHSLYTFDNFQIQSLSFGRPIFQEVLVHDYIYEIMHNSVLGTNVLSHLFWKFSMDDKQIILFSKKDTTLIKRETEGFLKIENGLRDNNVNLSFPPSQIINKFTLDLGYGGEIGINEKTFKQLSQYFQYEKILSTHSNTKCVFEGIDVYWNNIFIPNCLLVYNPRINLNLVGAKFMHRFNFILGYGDYIGHKPQQHLYLKPTHNFDEIKSAPYISDFGVLFKSKNEEFFISDIKVEGLADRAGLKVGDKLLSIDNVSFDSDSELDEYLFEKQTIRITIERDNNIIEYQLKY